MLTCTHFTPCHIALRWTRSQHSTPGIAPFLPWSLSPPAYACPRPVFSHTCLCCDQHSPWMETRGRPPEFLTMCTGVLIFRFIGFWCQNENLFSLPNTHSLSPAVRGALRIRNRWPDVVVVGPNQANTVTDGPFRFRDPRASLTKPPPHKPPKNLGIQESWNPRA